ncbi:MAG: BrnA antitoxin family protein [Candidatus Binatota bacterium]
MKKEYDFSKGKRGAVIQPPPGKTRITIRLDEEAIAWFKEQADAAGGANYQTLINQALREYIGSKREPLGAEDLLELRKAKRAEGKELKDIQALYRQIWQGR